jgi:hypothetical protein
MQSRGVMLLEESPDTTGQGRSVTPTRGNPRESATENDTADGAASREPRTGKGEMVR